MKKRLNTSQSRKSRQQQKQDQQSYLVTRCQYSDTEGLKPIQNQYLVDDIYANLHDPEEKTSEFFNDIMGPWSINENQRSQSPASFIFDQQMINQNTHPKQDFIRENESPKKTAKLVNLPRPISHNMISHKKQLTPNAYWFKHPQHENNKTIRSRTQTTEKQINLQQSENIETCLQTIINLQNNNIEEKECTKQKQNDVERIINQYFKSTEKQLISEEQQMIQKPFTQPSNQMPKRIKRASGIEVDSIPINKLLVKFENPYIKEKKKIPLNHKGSKQYYSTLQCQCYQTNKYTNSIQTECQGLKFKSSPYNLKTTLQISSLEVSPQKKFSFARTIQMKTQMVGENFELKKNGDEHKFITIGKYAKISDQPHRQTLKTAPSPLVLKLINTNDSSNMKIDLTKLVTQNTPKTSTSKKIKIKTQKLDQPFFFFKKPI